MLFHQVSEFWREKLDGMSASLKACEPKGGTSGGTGGTSSGGTEEGSSGGTEEGEGQDKKEEVPEVREEGREGDGGKELKTEEEESETKQEERKLSSEVSRFKMVKWCSGIEEKKTPDKGLEPLTLRLKV